QGVWHGRDHVFAKKRCGRADRGTAAKACPGQRARTQEVVNHANEQGVIAGYVWKKPPEVRYLPSGTPVANVRVGETVRYADGRERKEHTNWHSLIFYGKLTKIALALDKGD